MTKISNVKGHHCSDGIESRPCHSCYVCGDQGRIIYSDLKDRLFGAPGEWNLSQCLNPRCGLTWLDPMPMEKDISKAYEVYYTHQITGTLANVISSNKLKRFYYQIKKGYLALRYGYYPLIAKWQKLLGALIYLHPGYRAYLDFSIFYLKAETEGRMLEIGAGSGEAMIRMQELGWQVEGIDFDPIAVEKATKKGLTIHAGELVSDMYPTNHFDAITMSHVIEHVFEPIKLLNETYRILKKGGYLVIVTPNIESWAHAIYKRDWRGLEPPRHLHIFTAASLSYLAKMAGFEKINAFTSIAHAHSMFASCENLKKSINVNKRSALQRSAIRAWGRIMQMAEWAILKVRPNVGEDVILIAEK